jgi:dTDP-4-amino-4,6-dideoxygalactose transaminase
VALWGPEAGARLGRALMSGPTLRRIPLFDLHYGEEEERAVLNTLRSGWVSMGPNVRSLEEAFVERLGAAHAVATTNCTAALHLALQVLGVGPGDEVIVPSLTFVATANVVLYVGATPVFADITSLDDFSIDPEDVEAKITDATKAIVVMHYGGFPCDMDRICHIARARGLAVVEDAAHAPCSHYRDRCAGTLGDIGCFSFFSNKNITCGEGGLLVTSHDKYAAQARLLRSHGMTAVSYDRARGHATGYDVVGLGYNYRMDDVRGALALAQLARLDDDCRRRQELRACYLRNLSPLAERLIVPYEGFPHRSSNYIFPVVLRNGEYDERNKVRSKLAEAGIQTSVHYPAVHVMSLYARYGAALPKTEYVSGNEITLPLYYRLLESDIERITHTLKKVL